MESKYNLDDYETGDGFSKAIDILGLTQGQLANKLGVRKKKIENTVYRSNSSIIELLTWCNKLDCDIEFLLGFQDTKRKDAENICALTGLNESTVDLMKSEFFKPPESEVIVYSKNDAPDDAKKVPKNSLNVNSGVTTADLFNSLVESKEGKQFKNSMLQYITEYLVSECLKISIEDIVNNHNKQAEKNDTFELWLNRAELIYSDIRRITSLAGLKMTGRIQTKIADDSVNFCNTFKQLGFTELESKLFYDYVQSCNRLKALDQLCKEEVIQFLDEVAEDGNLTYNDSFLGIHEVTATLLYSQEDDEQKQYQDNIKKVKSLKAKLNKAESTNKVLNKELSDARNRIKELEEELKQRNADKADSN